MLKKWRFVFLAAAVLGLAAAPSSAITVSGTVYLHAAYDSYYFAPTGTEVKFCVSDPYGMGAQGLGECYFTTTSGSSYSIIVPPNKTYYFFVNNNAEDWGSERTNAWSNVAGFVGYQVAAGSSSFSGNNIISEPRPHEPMAVYPANNATNVPHAFNLKWTSGLDSYRIWPGVWNITYDVYAYGEGGQEIKALADIPCNPDSAGYCSYYIDNVVPNWRYFWRVVAKLQVTPGGRVFETDSGQFTFVTSP